MNTKFILVGGYPHKGENNGISFYKELIHRNKELTKILVCLFARPKDNWEKAFLQDRNFISTNLSNLNLDIKLASEEDFISELKWCDTIYFRGGDIDLIEIMKKFPSWENFLDGKVVAGSSMGADMLSRYYYDIVTNNVKPGSGITRSKVIVHWQSPEYHVDWDKALVELGDCGKDENLQTFVLKEGQYIIL